MDYSPGKPLVRNIRFFGTGKARKIKNYAARDKKDMFLFINSFQL